MARQERIVGISGDGASLQFVGHINVLSVTVVTSVTPSPSFSWYFRRILFIFFKLRRGGDCKIFYLKGLPAKYCGSMGYGYFLMKM